MQLKTSRQPHKLLATAGSLVLLAALSACGKPIDDQAIALHTQRAAEQAIAKSRAITERSLAQASGVLSAAALQAQVSAAETALAAGKLVEDTAITTMVNADLARDADLRAININVSTTDGVVTLMGPAPSAALKDKAARLAKSTVGVKSVDNQLVLKAG